MRDNVIEWLDGQQTVTVTFYQKKFVNRIKKLAESRNDVEIIAENGDGSICAHLPLKFIRISAPRELSEEQIALARERAKMNLRTPIQ